MTSVAEAFVDLKFQQNLERDLHAIMASIGDQTVTLDGDTTKLRDAIRAATLHNIKVTVDGDTTALKDSIRNVLTEIHSITINVDGDTTALREAIRVASRDLLGSIKIKLELDNASVANIRAQATILHRYLVALFNNIPIRFEINDLAGLLAQLAAIQALIASIGAGGGGGGPGGASSSVPGLIKFLGVLDAILIILPQVVAAMGWLIGNFAELLPIVLTAAPAMLELVGVFGVVALATQGMGAALSAAATGNVKAFDKAMKQLTPSAQAFVRELLKFGPAFKDIQKSIQQVLFAGLDKWIDKAVKTSLPALKKSLDIVAGQLNLVAGTVLHALSIPATAHDLLATFVGLNGGAKSLSGEMGHLVETFLRVSNVASGPLGGILQGFATDLDNLWKSTKAASEDGSLGIFIQRAADRFTELWNTVKQVISILNSFGSAAGDAGVNFKPLLGLITDWANYFKSPEGQAKLKEFFANAQTAIQNLKPLVEQLATAMGHLIDFLGQMAAHQDWSSITELIGHLNDLWTTVDKQPNTSNVIQTVLNPLGWVIAVSFITNQIINFYNWLGTPSVQGNPWGRTLQAVLNPLGWAQGIQYVVQQITAFYNWLATPSVQGNPWGRTLQAVVNPLGWVQALKWVADQLTAFGTWLGNWAVGLFPNLGSAFLTAGTNAISGFKNAISIGLNNTDSLLSGFPGRASGAVSPTSGAMGKRAQEAMDSLRAGFTNGLNNAVSVLRSVASRAQSAVGYLGNVLFGAGATLMDGLRAGIQQGVDQIRSILAQVTSMLPSWKGPLDLDRVLLTPNGVALMQGFMAGIENQVPALQSQLSGITGGLSLAAGGLTTPSVLGGQLTVRASDNANRDIQTLLNKLIDAVKSVGPEVGDTINGQGRNLTQSRRGS